MAAPDDQSTNEMASENEPIAIVEESNTDQVASQNHSIGKEKASNTSGPELESHPAINELASENSSITTNDVVPASSRIGLLSLPAELRLQIYRQLLLHDYPISTEWPIAGYERFPAILSICTLVRREAFQVMYGENFFEIGFTHPTYSILDNQKISDTIQNFHFVAGWSTDELAPKNRQDFIDIIRQFRSPAIVRGTLDIIFHVGHRREHFSWLPIYLRAFTNFRVIQIKFVFTFSDRCYPFYGHRDLFNVEEVYSIFRGAFERSLTPVYGPALTFADGCGLQFHPQDYLKSLPPKVDDSWMDYLDGIRLNWNQDPTNPDEH